MKPTNTKHWELSFWFKETTGAFDRVQSQDWLITIKKSISVQISSWFLVYTNNWFSIKFALFYSVLQHTAYFY